MCHCLKNRQLFFHNSTRNIKDNKYFAIVTHTLTSKSMSPDGIYDAWIVREVQITVPIKDIPGCYNRFKLYENIFDSKNSICNLATSLKKGSHMIQTYEPIDPIFYDDYNIIELLKQNGAAVNVVLYNFSIDAIAFMKDPHPELYM